jgi:hypothetical protein
MKQLVHVGLTIATLSIAACAQAVEDDSPLGTNQMAAIADARSFAKRPDGKFDVVCTDGRTQVVTRAQIAAQDVCKPVPPPPPPPADTINMEQQANGTFKVTCSDARVIIATADQIAAADVCAGIAAPGTVVSSANGADRSYTNYGGCRTSNEAVIETYGRGLWEGYVSMTVSRASAIVTLVDGVGNVYDVPASPTAFNRLPLPVVMKARSISVVSNNSTCLTPQGYYDSYYQPTTVGVTGLSFEVTKTIAVEPSSARGKFNGTDVSTLKTLGSDIAGAKVSFNASASFFRNFTNGNACARVTINGTELNAAAPARTITTTAPVSIVVNPLCVSARLGGSENALVDYEVGVSNFVIGPKP